MDAADISGSYVYEVYNLAALYIGYSVSNVSVNL